MSQLSVIFGVSVSKENHKWYSCAIHPYFWVPILIDVVASSAINYVESLSVANASDVKIYRNALESEAYRPVFKIGNTNHSLREILNNCITN